MREINKQDLPLKGKLINWKESSGAKVNFVYDDIKGYVIIKEYNPKTEYLTIIYNDKEFEIKTQHFKRCKLGNLLGIYTKDFKYKIGDIFKDEKRDFTIIDKEIRNIKYDNGRVENKKYYKYHCNKDGYEDWMLESNIKAGFGCPTCNNKVAILGINTIWDTDKWLIPIINDDEFCKTHTHSCSDKIYPTCPDCGRKKSKKISINTIYTFHSMFCSCSDGLSYPEKFVFNLIEQLRLNFEYHKTFEWSKNIQVDNQNLCGNKEYDFYLDNGILIEVNGLQHYEDASGVYKRTYLEEVENDKIKKEISLKNNIKEENYIIIDCRYSNLEYIKNSILNNEKIKNKFDLSKIDWLKCEQFALSSRITEAYEYWISGIHDTKEIGRVMRLSHTTIHRYLKKSTKIYNWVYEYYNPSAPRKVICLNDKKEYSSVREASKYYNCDESLISAVCRGKRKTTNNLTFMYYEDYLNL